MEAETLSETVKSSFSVSSNYILFSKDENRKNLKAHLIKVSKHLSKKERSFLVALIIQRQVFDFLMEQRKNVYIR